MKGSFTQLFSYCKKLKQTFLLLILFFVVSFNVFATTYTATQSGPWSSNTTWGGGPAPGDIIGAGDIVNIGNNHTVTFNLSNNLTVRGILKIFGNATLKFPNDGTIGTGKAIEVRDAGLVDILRATLLMPTFQTNGSNNNSNFQVFDDGVFRATNAYLEISQNCSIENSDGDNIYPRRIIRNSCFILGENFENNNGLDTLIGVCLEMGLHGSGNYNLSSPNSWVYYKGTQILLVGSGSFNASNTNTRVSGDDNALSRLWISNGNLENNGTWTAIVDTWCINGNLQGSQANQVDLMGPENCGAFAPPNNECTGCEALLPVELMKFSVAKHGETSILSWTTATETNNDFFEIQRADMQKNFVTIGNVKGAGNANAQTSYSFTDKTPDLGVNFYRLKQVDRDGQASLSPIRNVNFSKTLEISIYPNPTTDELIIRLNDWNPEHKTFIKVLDLNGTEVLTEQIKSTATRLTVTQLPAGTYFIQVANSATTEVYRFVKL